MSNISLLTIASGRREQLHHLLRGVAAQTQKPREVVVVLMNEAVPEKLPDPGCELRLYTINSEVDQLPVARARNRAAAEARGEMLAFLDVDCIPHSEYLHELEHAICLTKALVMADVRYLPQAAEQASWTDDSLDRLAQEHPRRPSMPADRSLMDLPYKLFWSLAFGIRKRDFERLGGFDEKYRGYGGEDTDFAFKARAAGVALYGCRARAYHQFHPTYTPPFNHIEDIVENARRFYEKWRIWPMGGWLRQFATQGYIEWGDHTIELLRMPEEETIEAARSANPFA